MPTQIAERLPAAAELFAERGLNDTEIEDIAAAIGIAKAALYYYFAGKKDILAFLLYDALHQLAGEVRRAVRRSTRPAGWSDSELLSQTLCNCRSSGCAHQNWGMSRKRTLLT